MRIVIASSPSLVYDGCAWIPSGASAETFAPARPSGAPCSILPLAQSTTRLTRLPSKACVGQRPKECRRWK